MKSYLKFLVAISLLCSAGSERIIEAQIFKNSMRTGDSENGKSGDATPNFAFSTSVGLSLTGPVYKSEFKLIDELGMEYDVMSLVKNKSIREELKLTNAQYEKMTDVKKNLNTNLSEFFKNLSSGGDIENVKKQILGAEVVLNTMLEPRQAERLEQLKNQIGINRYGIGPYLNSKSMISSLGLSEPAAKEFREKSGELKLAFAERKKKLNVTANRKLLSALSNSKQNKLEDFFADKTYQQFLESQLFADKKQSKRKLSQNKVTKLDALQNPKVRKELEIVNDQYKEIKELKSEYNERLAKASEKLFGTFPKNKSVKERAKSLAQLDAKFHKEFEEELGRTLIGAQLDRLDQIVAEIEATRMGTVGSLCYGKVSDVLSINERMVDQLYETGKQAAAERQIALKTLTANYEKEIFGLLSTDQGKRMANLIGERAKFDLR